MKYEIWAKENLGKRNGLPKDTFFTLDNSILRAIDLSKGNKTEQIWNPDEKNPFGTGSYESVDIPNAIAVIERGNKQSIIRGWGVGGKWFDARNCKRCNNSGQDVNNYRLPCNSCKGSSYNPKV